MAAFETRLDILQLGRRRWELHAELIYLSDRVGRVVVPAEFITDLASVPRLPFAYWLAGDRARGPAVVHDYGYLRHLWTREVTDRVFLEAMAAHQPDLGFEAESPAIRTAMYSAVRLGAGRTWDRYAQRSAALNPIWTATGWPATAVA